MLLVDTDGLDAPAARTRVLGSAQPKTVAEVVAAQVLAELRALDAPLDETNGANGANMPFLLVLLSFPLLASAGVLWCGALLLDWRWFLRDLISSRATLVQASTPSQSWTVPRGAAPPNRSRKERATGRREPQSRPRFDRSGAEFRPSECYEGLGIISTEQVLSGVQ